MRTIGRRSLLAGVVGAGAMAVADADTPQSKKAPRKLANPADLDRAAAAPVLKVDGLTSPVIIESMKLLKKDRDYMVHVRSKDGAEGVSLTNPPRAPYLDHVFQQLVAPFFIGKDGHVLFIDKTVRPSTHVDDIAAKQKLLESFQHCRLPVPVLGFGRHGRALRGR